MRGMYGILNTSTGGFVLLFGIYSEELITEKRRVHAMKRIKAFGSFFLAMLMLLSTVAALAGCGETPVEDPVQTQAPTTTAAAADAADDGTTAPPETTAEPIKDNLPDKNYNNEEFYILCMEELKKYYLATEEDQADILGSAVYARNRTVEERFGVKIVPIPLPGMAAGSSGFIAAIDKSVNAMDGAYDIVAPNYWYGIDQAAKGSYLDLLQFEYLDFDQPWWAAGYVDNLVINDKLYATTGDYDLQQYSSLLVTFFNQDLIEKNGMENPYDLVEQGKWTYETMYSMASKVGGDLNGDSGYDDQDLYGGIWNKWAIRGFLTAFDLRAVSLNESGELEVTLQNEKSIDAYDKIFSLIHNEQFVYKSTGGYTDNDKMISMFTNDQALFFGIHLSAAELMRDMKNDYGIVPMPKWDEKQENYVTGSVGCTIFAIPISATDPEKSSIILEALCMESYRQVVPVYYETILKYRDARDAKASEMIELCRNTLFYDWGYIWDTSIGGPYIAWGDHIVMKSGGGLASWFAAEGPLYKSTLKRLLRKFE